jgi:hypothetical protein
MPRVAPHHTKHAMTIIHTARRIAARFTLPTAAALLLSFTPAHAELLSYYIGVDNQATIPSGTYAGLANPNYNRLTLLFAHHYPVGGIPTGHTSNHYHSKGIYRYTGDNLGANTATVFNVSDYVPEGTLAPLPLTLGTGIYAAKLVTNASSNPSDPLYHFSQLEIGNTQSLAGFGAEAGETYMFNSSAGRWNSAFADADVHFELVSLTPGLHLGSTSLLDLVGNPGDDVHLGEGSEFFGFTPILWTASDAAPGIYEATFKIVDESGTFGESGEIRLRTEVIPEPGSALLLALGLSFVVTRRARRLATLA